jgi:transposase
MVQAYRDGGLDALCKWDPKGPIIEMTAIRDIIRNSLEEHPVRTVAEATQRINELTGLERKPTRVRKFLKALGLDWKRTRAVPVPPNKLGRAHP